MSLRRDLAEHGFESNDDYEFQVRSLLAAQVEHLRCLQIAGDSGRRKTALANALAHALKYPRILYLDFTQPEPALPVIALSAEESSTGANENPMSAFERIVIEACAFSEAEPTVLILDQLQAADFREQIRLFHFVQSGDWQSTSGSVRAHQRQLLIVLISEQALYHSLAHLAYRIWADPSSGRFEHRPEDFGRGLDAREMFAAFAQLFEQLHATPTPSEFQRLLDDAERYVRTPEQLRHSIFGWMERIDRTQLFSPALTSPIEQCVHAINNYVGVDEIELGD